MSCELGFFLLSGQPKAPLSVSISQALEDIKLYEGKTHAANFRQTAQAIIIYNCGGWGGGGVKNLCE
jgi:hypothetical protein